MVPSHPSAVLCTENLDTNRLPQVTTVPLAPDAFEDDDDDDDPTVDVEEDLRLLAPPAPPPPLTAPLPAGNVAEAAAPPPGSGRSFVKTTM